MAEPDYSDDMRLPEGKTCADCLHGARCDGLFGAVRRNFTSCDFWPSRYADGPATLILAIGGEARSRLVRAAAALGRTVDDLASSAVEEAALAWARDNGFPGESVQ